jgi:hypothetical protein
MTPSEINSLLESILIQYQKSFAGKTFSEESSEIDDLMSIFSLTQEVKMGNRQYWGRELGMCWQKIVTELCRAYCTNFKDAIREGGDELCDLVVENDAIDTKYRIGSGDSGTLKKFKSYGKNLSDRGLNPVVLIVREDNLQAAITACRTGGWRVISGKNSYEYIDRLTGFDLHSWLVERKGKYSANSQGLSSI